MNVIEQMYKEYGVEHNKCCKYAHYGYEGEQETWYFCEKKQKECDTYPEQPNSVCSDRKTTYPQFTAEKQIELIKLMLNNKIIIDMRYCFSNYRLASREHIGSEADFESALASLIIKSKDDLDNSKVKEILEK